jgi:hypothetical protein
MSILILPAHPCRSYHVTCDGYTKACLLGATLSQPLKPIQGDDKVPKRLNRIPLSSKSHCPLRHSNLGSSRLQDSQVSHASFPLPSRNPTPLAHSKSRRPTNGRLYDCSWIVRHENGWAPRLTGRLAFGGHHEQGSRVAGEQGCNPNPRALPQF